MARNYFMQIHIFNTGRDFLIFLTTYILIMTSISVTIIERVKSIVKNGVWIQWAVLNLVSFSSYDKPIAGNRQDFASDFSVHHRIRPFSSVIVTALVADPSITDNLRERISAGGYFALIADAGVNFASGQIVFMNHDSLVYHFKFPAESVSCQITARSPVLLGDNVLVCQQRDVENILIKANGFLN
jgi:hypothetical protein